MNVILIGPRGSGKSTLARLIASALWRQAVDMDELVLARFDETTVADVWKNRGESAWRAAEIEVMREVLAGDEQVIAAGGGAPTIEAIQTMLAEAREAGRAKVVYLQCDPGVLRERLSRDGGDRPSLTGGDPIAEIEQVVATRDDLYRRAADVTLDVTQLSPREAADYLMRTHF